MPRIDVVGLGPADEKLITVETRILIDRAEFGFVRTRRHPAASAVAQFVSFDDVYEKESTIDNVYGEISHRLRDAAVKHGSIVYAVPGSPLVAETTVQLLQRFNDIDVVIHPAMSFLELCWKRLSVDPFSTQSQLVDGHLFAGGDLFIHGAVLISQCDSKEILSAIKLSAHVDSSLVTVMQRLGLPDEKVFSVNWNDLDRVVEPDHLTSLWVPSFPAGVGDALVALDNVVRELRESCPWDRKQTHATLSKHLLEEAYETIEAIGLWGELGGYESDSPNIGAATEHLIEELGDVFMQIFMHAAIARQAGEFTIVDVADRIREKLIHRHPHVFGDVEANTPEDVERNWEVLKEQEGKVRDADFDIPDSLPALSYTSELRERMAKRGFSYLGTNWGLDDVKGEVEELREALEESGGEISDHVFAEFGDVLLASVSLGNNLGIDPEAAMRATAARFRERFLRFEILVQVDGRQPADVTREEMLRLWKEAKAS